MSRYEDRPPLIVQREFAQLGPVRVRLVRFDSGHHLLTFEGEMTNWQIALDPGDVVALNAILSAMPGQQVSESAPGAQTSAA